MKTIQTNESDKTPISSESSEDFKFYARPLTAKLLETMELSRNYTHGDGDYLYFEKNSELHHVLDLTGGYGANFLGHKNPQIMNLVRDWTRQGAPSLTQGSIRESSGKLARVLSDLLKEETGEGPWVTTFSNSGTEAVEAALKHCLIHFQHRMMALTQEIDKEMNIALVHAQRIDSPFKEKYFRTIRQNLLDNLDDLKMPQERKSFFLHQLTASPDLEDLVSLLREINLRQIQDRPSFIALEKAYHGKTMGALDLTANESFRQSFYLNSKESHTKFISQYIDSLELQNIMGENRFDLIHLSLLDEKVVWTKHGVSKFAGAFAEPIQGEAGVIPVTVNFLSLLKKYSLQEHFLLVFDEIQAGMYRTGTLASGTHSDITADIYTFSKSLGGGVAKIAATVINQKKYVDEFGFLHSSTFSDDDFSSQIALKVLDILKGEDSPLPEAMKASDYLWARLTWLKQTYPKVVKEIRGKGLMLAIEFHDVFESMGLEFKTICDAHMQGYLMSSCLLNHESLRMNPSLSNGMTLRIQPSVYFRILQAEELIQGLGRLCEAMNKKDMLYFLKALYPDMPLVDQKGPELKLDLGNRPLAVFLCHVIDADFLRLIYKPLRKLPTEALLKKLTLSKDIAEFNIYHAQPLKDKNGQEIDVVLLALSMTSEDLKKTFSSKKKYQLVQKIQSAIDLAKELGASTVGLGQFTSIVSGNGLYLNSRGLNITTGNAYTVSLTVQSALRSAKEKQIDLSRSTVALIGAAGNIMSVATSLMSDYVAKIIMIHHSPLDTSLKYQIAVKRILNEIINSSSDSAVTKVMKQFWTPGADLLRILAMPEVKEVFEATSDIARVKEAQIVMAGASASTGFLTFDLFQANAVVVDVAVPPSIKKELLDKLKVERPDLTYHLGGVAKIPQDQSIKTSIFPLPDNECYACMAETFSIGFSQKKNFLNIGDLDKAIVNEVEQLASEAGFILGSIKDKISL